MAMKYEQAKKILETYSSFPRDECEQREIIRLGTKNGVIYGRGGGKISYDKCNFKQAYVVANRLYFEALNVIQNPDSEYDRRGKGGKIENVVNKESLSPSYGGLEKEQITKFLSDTGTKSLEDWGGFDGAMEYLNPQ